MRSQRDPLALPLVFVILLFLLASFRMPWSARRGHSERERACYSNMRVILGAIEMYNMDHSVMIATLTSDVPDRLMRGGYLKSHFPRCFARREPRSSIPWVQLRLQTFSDNLRLPSTLIAEYEFSGGTYSGQDLTGDGRIVCSEHGTVEE